MYHLLFYKIDKSIKKNNRFYLIESFNTFVILTYSFNLYS